MSQFRFDLHPSLLGRGRFADMPRFTPQEGLVLAALLLDALPGEAPPYVHRAAEQLRVPMDSILKSKQNAEFLPIEAFEADVERLAEQVDENWTDAYQRTRSFEFQCLERNFFAVRARMARFLVFGTDGPWFVGQDHSMRLAGLFSVLFRLRVLAVRKLFEEVIGAEQYVQLLTQSGQYRSSLINLRSRHQPHSIQKTVELLNRRIREYLVAWSMSVDHRRPETIQIAERALSPLVHYGKRTTI